MRWRTGGEQPLEISRIKHPVTNLDWKLAKVNFIYLFILLLLKLTELGYKHTLKHSNSKNKDTNTYQLESVFSRIP